MQMGDEMKKLIFAVYLIAVIYMASNYFAISIRGFGGQEHRDVLFWGAFGDDDTDRVASDIIALVIACLVILLSLFMGYKMLM